MSEPKVEAWMWRGKNGETGTLSFDPPLARFKNRCVHLVERDPAAEAVVLASIAALECLRTMKVRVDGVCWSSRDESTLVRLTRAVEGFRSSGLAPVEPDSSANSNAQRSAATKVKP